MLPTDLALIRSKRDVDLLQRFDPLRRKRVADLLEPLLGAHCNREQRSFFFFFLTPNLPKGRDQLKKTFFFGGCPNEGGGGLPMPEFFGLFQEVHFWSLKRVYFFKNANVLNF